MMYSSYSFYTEDFHGVNSVEDYTRCIVRATAEIERITFGRAKTATGADFEAVKLAECAVVDELIYQTADGKLTAGDIVSESNDGISRTYASGISKTSRQRIDAAAFTFLCNTNLCCTAI